MLSALRGTHWLRTLLATFLAIAVLTFALHRVHAASGGVAMSEACHVQVHGNADDHHHGDNREPMEKSSCCVGICADFVSPVAMSLTTGQPQSYVALLASDHAVMRSLTPDSPHRPPRA